MATPANYATLIAEIDAIIDDYALTLREVTGGLTVQPSLDRLIDLRYKLFESGGGSSSITTNTSIEYGAGAVTAKTQRVAVADFAIAPVGAHTTNSSLGSAVTLTQPSGASRILLQAFTQNVRFLFTETTNTTVPTASVGFRLLAGERIDLSVPTGCLLKVIEETASASIQYQWVI